MWRSKGKEGAECEICATLPPSERVNYTQLHPHHIIGRSARLTRWDLRNRIWVCPTHHTMNQEKGVEYNRAGWFWGAQDDWLGKHRPEDKSYLESLREPYKKWTLEELEEMVEELSSI